MQYDCGALANNPNQSPIFRYITTTKTRSPFWPKHIQREAAIFISTPGISWNWVQHVLKMDYFRIANLRRDVPDCRDRGRENELTATYDDAINYVRLAPPHSNLPLWALPFYLEDAKNGMSYRELNETWGFRSYSRRRNFIRY